MEVTFLLGAGVSMAVDLPSTRDITDAVLADPRLRRQSNGSIYLEPQAAALARASAPRGDVFYREGRLPIDRYQACLRCLRDEVATRSNGTCSSAG